MDRFRGGEARVVGALERFYEFLPEFPQLLFLIENHYGNLMSIMFPKESADSAAISHPRD